MPSTAEDFAVTAGAGTLADAGATTTMPHRWSDGGVTITGAFTGAHLLHLAVAGCVLNDLYRYAAEHGITLRGVRVSAAGRFDTDGWRSEGVDYRVELDSGLSPEQSAAMLASVDEVAEIPRALRLGAPVARRRPPEPVPSP